MVQGRFEDGESSDALGRAVHPGGLSYSFEPDELGEVTLILIRLGSREG